MEVQNVARAATGVVFCVMTLIMLLSKKGDFVWEIKNEMEMCFGSKNDEVSE